MEDILNVLKDDSFLSETSKLFLNNFENTLSFEQLVILKSILGYHDIYLVKGLTDFPYMQPHEILTNFYMLNFFELKYVYNPDMLNSNIILVPLFPSNFKHMPDHLLFCNDACYAIQNKYMFNEYSVSAYKFKHQNYFYTSDIINVSGFFSSRNFDPISSTNFLKAFPSGVNNKYVFNDFYYLFNNIDGDSLVNTKSYIKNLFIKNNTFYKSNPDYLKLGIEYIKNKNNLNIHDWHKTEKIKIMWDIKKNNMSNCSLKTAVNLIKNIK